MNKGHILPGSARWVKGGGMPREAMPAPEGRRAGSPKQPGKTAWIFVLLIAPETLATVVHLPNVPD